MREAAMPQPLEIVQERAVGFDAHGKRTHTLRSYIKLDESAETLLGELSGVYLTFFLCVSLHEIAVCSRGAMPYTRADVCRVTRRRDGKATISERAAIYATKWLVENGFIYECGTRTNGEKMYRPCGTYAWFGDDHTRGANFAPPEAGVQPVAPLPDSGVHPTAPLGCKRMQIGVQNDASPGGGRDTLDCLDQDPPAPSEAATRSKRKTTTSAQAPRSTSAAEVERVRAVLGLCGMYGPRANALARQVDLERAQRWERWCRYAHANLNYHNPAGIALYRLEADPEAEPPDWQEVEDWERDQHAQQGLPVPDQPPTEATPATPDLPTENEHSYVQALPDLAMNATALWRATLDELRLQLPQATFNTWLRPSRALGFENETLLVKTHSPYAKEWLSIRLNTAVQRTLSGIANKSLTVRYE
jgi:hypothetical protein